MSKPDPSVIRECDLVRVINPEVLIRVGYPMSIEDATREVEERYKEKVLDILFDMNGRGEARGEVGVFLLESKFKRSRTYKNVMRELAFGYLRAKGFGGRERRIYTRTEPKLKGEVFPVRRIKFHKTGDYYPPQSWGNDYFGGDEGWEPGGLENERTHKFVDVCTYGLLKMDGSDGTWIEVCNVEKMHEEDDEL